MASRLCPVDVKAILVGDSNCGKTNLVIAYTQNKSPEKRIQRFVGVNVILDDYKVHLSICSFSGVLDYYSRLNLYSKASVILLCFSVDNLGSFENIEKRWLPEIRDVCPQAKLLLVGNKGDVRKFRDESYADNQGRKIKNVVKAEDCILMVDRVRAYAYIECSAQTLQGVEQVFEAAITASLSPVWFSSISGSNNILPGFISESTDSHLTTLSGSLHTSTSCFFFKKQDTCRYNLVAVGDANSGKTTLLSAASKLVSKVYTEPIITIQVNEYKVDLSLWKTHGSDQDGNYTRKACYNADVILMCFSLINKNSLKNVKKKWLKELKLYCPKEVPIVVVGNKKDLVEPKQSLLCKHKHKVYSKEGLKMAQSMNTSYIECSALCNDDVLLVFQSAARAVLQKYLKVTFTF